MQEVIIVTDLGPGDGGKGSIVHALSYKHDASVIIKRGGAQGSHGVRTSSGEKFNFSQWSCGTFEGVPTFLSEQMVISPIGLVNEAETLRNNGISQPFLMLNADPECICATPYHKVSSQLEEIKLRDHPRGTVGTGVGQAYRMAEKLGEEYTVKAFELDSPEIIKRKLKKQLEYYRDLYLNLKADDVLEDDEKNLIINLERLKDQNFFDFIVEVFLDAGDRLKLNILSEVLKQDGLAIVECSHGVLTDAETGFKPHVSTIRTLPEFSESMLKKAGFNGKIKHLAVHRAYEIRHGAGPIPTYDEDFTMKMLQGSYKDVNRWQGKVRAGPLDFNLIRHALKACQNTHFDGLCMTWFDQILKTDRSFKFAMNYVGDKDVELTTEFLKTATPKYFSTKIENPISGRDLIKLLDSILLEETGLKLHCLSVGPTEVDKIYSE